jgi:elongation factor G
MKVEVVVPEDFMGQVIGDLSSRRGKVQGTELRGQLQGVQSEVPLSEMFGYATDVRSLTEGRATFTMEFSTYSNVPTNIYEQLRSKEA